VKAIEASLQFPVGMFGRPVSDDEKKAWLPDVLQVLSRLRDTVATTALNPVIIVALRRAIQWHLEYSQIGTRDAARKVMASVPRSLELRIALALFDGSCDFLGERGTNVRETEAAKRVARASLAADVVTTHTDHEIVALLEDRVSAQLVAFSGQAGTPGPFVADLIDARHSVGVAICEAVVADPDAKVHDVVAVAISRLADLRPDEAMTEVRALLATGNLRVKRTVAQALGWNRGAGQP